MGFARRAALYSLSASVRLWVVQEDGPVMDDGPKMGDGNNEKRKAAFHAIVGRALTDTNFRGQLTEEGTRQTAVSAALEGTGVEYSEIERELKAAIAAVQTLAEKFDTDLKIAS